MSEQNNLPPEMQQFFKRFGGQLGGMPGQQQARPVMAQGSGFFISGTGYIVTNNHVVENAKTVTVTMDNGKTLDAKVIGTDQKTDLALLKVNEKGDYPFVSLAKDAPRVGEPSPPELSQPVAGISALAHTTTTCKSTRR
jgi:serine protease Do